jgi:hypothetical protein
MRAYEISASRASLASGMEDLCDAIVRGEEE